MRALVGSNPTLSADGVGDSVEGGQRIPGWEGSPLGALRMAERPLKWQNRETADYEGLPGSAPAYTAWFWRPLSTVAGAEPAGRHSLPRNASSATSFCYVRQGGDFLVGAGGPLLELLPPLPNQEVRERPGRVLQQSHPLPHIRACESRRKRHNGHAASDLPG